ncbi:hypothetical protein [Anaerolentibacter hominis]|uniref:hypothetical protein n=1 Tax=Anaerolentibacter hominis TaxID=3079009 RepID=UPI0031B89189
MRQQEKIYDAITDVREDLIEEALTTKLQPFQTMWRKWAVIAAVFALVVTAAGTGLHLLSRNGAGNPPAQDGAEGGGSNGNTGFMSYAGPVFPLTLTKQTDGITAERNLVFDFTQSKSGEEQRLWKIPVSDDYSLTNETEEDKTVTLLYPFAGNFREMNKPVISVDGKVQDTVLYAGPYSGGFTGTGEPEDEGSSLNLEMPGSWEDYKALLENGEYERTAFSDPPVLDQKVIVYRLSDTSAGMDSGEAPTLAIEFSMDYDKTKILTYGFNGAEWDEESQFARRSYFIAEPGRSDYGRDRYLVVLGEDIGDYKLQGYQDGGCEKGEEMEGVSADVARYETTLGELLRNLTGEYLEQYEGGGSVPFELYYGEVCRFFAMYGTGGEREAERYQTGMLEDIIAETSIHKRICYLTLDITIPAGESVEVKAELKKEPSFDFGGSGSDKIGVRGFDMVTTLGSRLDFTNQTAEIRHSENVEITAQTFGFDLENGIEKVTLDLNTEHYYLDVRDKTD